MQTQFKEDSAKRGTKKYYIVRILAFDMFKLREHAKKKMWKICLRTGAMGCPDQRSKTYKKVFLVGLLHLADHVPKVANTKKSSRHLLLLDFSGHMDTKRIPDPSQVRLN